MKTFMITEWGQCRRVIIVEAESEAEALTVASDMDDSDWAWTLDVEEGEVSEE